jgi:hypothetical protein
LQVENRVIRASLKRPPQKFDFMAGFLTERSVSPFLGRGEQEPVDERARYNAANAVFCREKRPPARFHNPIDDPTGMSYAQRRHRG